MPTDALLADVLEAHGGLERWRRLTTLTARLTVGGPFWTRRGWPGDVTILATLDTRREHVELAYADLRATFDVPPERLALRAAAGRLVECRTQPRASFPAFDPATTRWDAVQIAYVHCTSAWNALTAPFSFTALGVGVHELEPCEDDGRRWRRLAVMFPPSNATHNADQVFYYDDDLMLRRWDSAPDVAGGRPIAQYAGAPVTVEGFVFPTRRRTYPRHVPGVADRRRALRADDVGDICLGRGPAADQW